MLGGGERGEDTSSAWKIEIEVPEPFSSGCGEHQLQEKGSKALEQHRCPGGRKALG